MLYTQRNNSYFAMQKYNLKTSSFDLSCKSLKNDLNHQIIRWLVEVNALLFLIWKVLETVLQIFLRLKPYLA